MLPKQWDMHVHLDFMRNAEEIVGSAADLGLGLFAVTVTPQGFLRIGKKLRNSRNLCLCAGLHPWWVADGRCGQDDVELTAALVKNTRFVGEIGLDASPKHVPEGSLDRQAAAFETICTACAQTSTPSAPKVLSIHSVKAASLTLDILEKTGCLESCRCIFHWFTGSGEELNRAVKAGCFFSINEMMLRTRRGRDYARQIPAKALLLETDLPPGEDIPFSADNILNSMKTVLTDLNTIRNANTEEIILSNSERILGLNGTSAIPKA